MMPAIRTGQHGLCLGRFASLDLSLVGMGGMRQGHYTYRETTYHGADRILERARSVDPVPDVSAAIQLYEFVTQTLRVDTYNNDGRPVEMRLLEWASQVTDLDPVVFSPSFRWDTIVRAVLNEVAVGHIRMDSSRAQAYQQYDPVGAVEPWEFVLRATSMARTVWGEFTYRINRDEVDIARQQLYRDVVQRAAPENTLAPQLPPDLRRREENLIRSVLLGAREWQPPRVRNVDLANPCSEIVLGAAKVAPREAPDPRRVDVLVLRPRLLDLDGE